MAQKARRWYVDYLVYLAVRTLVGVIQALPLRIALGTAEVLAKLAYTIDKRHRQVAADNLRIAFPDRDEAAIDSLVHATYRHCCRLLIEIILLPRKMRVDNWKSIGQLIGGDVMLYHLMRDRPVLMVTAHFGNWELAGYALGACGFRTYAIARVLDNPYLEGFLKQFRQATGQTIIAKKDDFDRLQQVLTAGGKVATLGDQDAGPRGVFVNFFGRPASAHKAVALMALEFGTPMMVIGVPRVADLSTGIGAYYELVCEDLIDPKEYVGKPDAVKAITQRYHDALERIIRRYPEQYFWLHRRWKTQPSVKKVPLAKAA